MTIREIINLHPHPSDLDRDVLLRCIEECLDCAASCTACADACLGESDLAELRRCIRLNLDCADLCGVTVRLLSRQSSREPRVLHDALLACIVACSSGSEYSPLPYSRNASRTSRVRSGSRTTLAMSLPAAFSRTFR